MSPQVPHGRRNCAVVRARNLSWLPIVQRFAHPHLIALDVLSRIYGVVWESVASFYFHPIAFLARQQHFARLAAVYAADPVIPDFVVALQIDFAGSVWALPTKT